MDDPLERVVFRVLGPFEAVVGQKPAPLGGARQRLVLAGLLANANAVVSSDRLIDIVWGDQPPSTALTTLQKYVYRLRASLGERLVRHAPGYLLRVNAGESDASRFESLLADATRLTTAGELTGALAAFDAALGLWRGPAWAEFADFEFARADVARLEALRATAVEDRTEVALAAGRHGEVIGELEATVARSPLRERPRAQLMLALYRSGRQAEALRAYDAFRRYLGDEVGLEPSASLAQLADSILLQKPELDWVPPPGAGGRPALPSGVVTFLFTDIDGSARLFRQLGRAYVELLERHRRLVRAAAATAGGVEVNSEGDGLFFAFSSAAEGLAASVAAERALVAEEWPAGSEVRVRMGLHTGEAAPHNGDYDALAVRQAAWVKDAAHGGQILLSEAAVGSIAGDMPAECSVLRLGTFPVRDFDGGVALFEARHPSLPALFPPPRINGAASGTAPMPAALVADTEPLIGRATELEWLEVLWQRAVAGERVTALLYGPSGIGKSRLLAEFARRAHARGATVRISAPEGAPGASEPVLTVLDDFDGSTLDVVCPTAAGVLVLAAGRHLVGGTTNTREIEGLSPDEVGLLLAYKVEAVTIEFSDAIHTETHGNPGQVHDVARRLRDREAEERMRRALERVGPASHEFRSLRDAIAGSVLERESLAARAPDVAAVGVCPYKGLARYEAADAPFFHGRERLVATLVARIAVDRFVGVIGASGSGKSSLVRAGLLPALSAGALPGSGAWPTCTCTPGEHPLRQLADALAPLVGVPAAELARRLDRQPDELGPVLEAALRGRAGARVVVVVDQFEELLTLCRDQEERERFVGAVIDAVTDPTVPAVVVPVLRADYYGALAVHPDFGGLFEQSQVLVGAMSDAELRRAITEPATRAGLVLEDGLVDAVCEDAGPEAAALPLVSTALAETWVRRHGTTLSLAAYRDAGGVHGALAHLADDVYASLDADGQALARRLFLRLAEPGEGADDVRRRMPRGEFSAGAAGDEVLDAFVGRRLLVADGGSLEVAHEALLREWPRLRLWLEEDRDGRRLHRHLTEAAVAWATEERDPGALYRGARLGAAQDFATSNPGALNAAEREFLDMSTSAQQQELMTARRTAHRLRSLSGAMAAFLAVALVAGGLALVQRSRADDQATRARAATRSAQIDRAVAATPKVLERDRAAAGLVAAAAERLRPGPDTRGALLTAISDEPRLQSTISGGRTYLGLAVLGPDMLAVQAPGGVDIVDLTHHAITRRFDLRDTYAIAATSDGRLVAAGNVHGAVEFWDPASGTPDGAPLQFSAPVAGLAFSPDGRTLAVALGAKADPAEIAGDIGGAATVTNRTRIVDVASRAPTEVLAGHRSTDNALIFTADGKELITGDDDGLVITRDATTGAPIGTAINFHAPIWRLAASPDGRYLGVLGFLVASTANDHIATVYDRATGAVVSTISGDESVGNIAFDSSGTHFVVAGINGAQVYDVPSFATLGTEIATQHGEAHAEFLASGLLALTGLDGTLTLWKVDDTVASGRPVPGSPIGGGEFSPDGASLALVGTDDTATLYRSSDLSRIGTVSVGTPGPAFVPTPFAFSPDGLKLVVGDRFGRVRFFTATSLQPLGPPIPVASSPIETVKYSPSGKTVVAVSYVKGNGAYIVDVAARQSRPLVPPIERPLEPAFSPDGRWLLVPMYEGAVAEYPVVDGVPGTGHVFLTPSVDVASVAFSPDSRTVAVGTPQGAILLLDAVTFRQLGPPISVSLQNFVVLVFSPDGHYLATVDNYFNVRLVDLAQRAVLDAALPNIPVSLDAISFSPDSATLVLGSTTGSVLLDLEVTTWLARACARAGRDLTTSEIAQYFSATPKVHACP
jgi:DNA-binding SARP family transcriptional activator/WD40 repeat protein/energy-coupling factor transporter ATP-binding protein EcfA2